MDLGFGFGFHRGKSWWKSSTFLMYGNLPSVIADFGRDRYALANVGPNILTGNDLQSGLGAWTAVSGTVTASGGVMRITGDGSGGRAQYTMNGLTVGKVYVLTFNFQAFNGTNIVYAVSPNASSAPTNADMVGSSSGTGAKQLLFVATGTSRNVLVAIGNTAVGNWADVSDFVVREITSTFGPNLVRNGDFTTDLTGWTDASTAPATVVWSGSGALTSTDGVAAARLRQTIVTIPGRTYVFSHTGGAACAVGTTAGGQELLAFKQTASRTFVAAGTATYVSMATSGNALTLDDVSVREVLVGFGPELVANSEFDTDLSGWSPLSGADITSTWVNGAIQIVRGTGGASGAPTSTAIALNPGRTYVIVAGNVGSATCRVALTGGQVFGDGSSNMDVAAGAVGTKTFTATISSSAILLYPAGTSATTLMNYVSVREVLTNQPVQPVGIHELLSVSSGAKSIVANDNTLKTIPANYPAFDYSTGQRRLLLEGAATNIVLNSSVLSTQSVTVSATSYTLSFYGTGTVTLSGAYTGSLAGGGVASRVSLVFTPSAGTLTLTVSGSVTLAQLEAGTVASSYIATAGSQVTRVTDVCAFSPLLNLGITQMSASMAYRGAVKTAITSQTIIGLAGFPFIRGSGAGTAFSLDGNTSGVTLLVEGILPGTVGAAFGWDSSGRALAVNGSAVVADTRVLDRQAPPFYFGPHTGQFAGAVQEIGAFVVWPLKGTNSNLQAQARVYA